MLNRTEKFYDGRLQRYFDRYYIEYSETVEYFTNPAINKWKFIVPELGVEITLTCNNIGLVSEKRERI